MKTERTIKVDYLARVEGEGALDIVVTAEGEVTDCRLRIFEPPRFFEAFLQGKSREEVPDVTARICGICPVAYQMSSAHALEAAAGVHMGEPIRTLRRLLYCGEWIESHVLHVHMLHAPDFLGYESAISMAADHGDVVKRALRMKKAGNDLVDIIGGRSVHPVSVRVGGFSRPPRKRELKRLLPDLERTLDDALDVVKFFATLDFPDKEIYYDFVSLSHPDEYPMNEGKVVSSKGPSVTFDEYEDHYREEHVAHSNALHSRRVGGGTYHVGPLARLYHCMDRLHPTALQSARECGVPLPTTNPFVSIVVRAVETVHAVAEAIDIINGYNEPASALQEVPIQAGRGCWATEAPRGLLYHSYDVDESGSIVKAKIVPPTSQNQPQIEEDLRSYAPELMDLDQEDMTWKLEQLVRCYDPCISCATHFLKVNVIHPPVSSG